MSDPVQSFSAGSATPRQDLPELTPEQIFIISDMIHAWIDREKKGEFRQSFRTDCKRLLATVMRAPEPDIVAMRAALMEIRFIANGSGNPRTMIAKIFDIATRGSRGEYQQQVTNSRIFTGAGLNDDDEGSVSAAQSSQDLEPVAFINARLTDLAEANALYGKDQRLNAPDKIARNDREISWLKDLRSLVVSSTHCGSGK